MSDFNGRFGASAFPARADMSVDAGLRAFMLGVYNKLGLGLLVAAALAWSTVNVPAVMTALYRVDAYGRFGFTPLGMAVQWAPLVILLLSSFTMRNPTAKGASLLYWLVVSLIGLSLGVVLLAYTGGSVASTFFATAAAFGGLSLFGYVTKRDLTAFGAFLMVGLIGLIVASLVNVLLLHSSGATFVISIIGVLIFAGLTAYDTQKLKMVYYQIGGDRNALGVMTSYGALSLFLDFLNLFLFMLRIFGNRR
jgi:FtsH-binding integral membrane protein